MGKEHTHIFAHNFLNIQLIFNLEKVLVSWDLDPITVYINACWSCRTRLDSKFHLIRSFFEIFAKMSYYFMFKMKQKLIQTQLDSKFH